MDPISNVDVIVSVLRQRLVERSRREAAGRTREAAKVRDRPVSRSQALQALAEVEGIDDRQLGRALIQTVLADHFGARLINEAQFQQLVDRVSDTLQEEPGTSKLVQRIVDELRSSAR